MSKESSTGDPLWEHLYHELTQMSLEKGISWAQQWSHLDPGRILVNTGHLDLSSTASSSDLFLQKFTSIKWVLEIQQQEQPWSSPSFLEVFFSCLVEPSMRSWVVCAIYCTSKDLHLKRLLKGFQSMHPPYSVNFVSTPSLDNLLHARSAIVSIRIILLMVRTPIITACTRKHLRVLNIAHHYGESTKLRMGITEPYPRKGICIKTSSTGLVTSSQGKALRMPLASASIRHNQVQVLR